MSQPKPTTPKASQVVDGILHCRCTLPTVQLTSRSEANPGRVFRKCPKDREDTTKCSFFKWEDEVEGLRDGLENADPQAPRKDGPSSSQRDRSSNVAEASPAKLARRNMIAEAKAEAHGGDTPVKQTPAPTAKQASSSASSSAFKPKKEREITPSQEAEVEVKADEQGAEDDGMDLDRESDIEDPHTIVRTNQDPDRAPGPRASGRKPVDDLDEVQESQFDNEGSPKKKDRSLKAKDKQKGKAAESLREEEDAVPKTKKKEVTSSSQASSSTRADAHSVLASPVRPNRIASNDPEGIEEALSKLSKQFKALARKVATAKEVAELKQRMDDMDDKEEQLRNENQMLTTKTKKLEDQVRDLKIQVRGLQTRLESLGVGEDAQSD